VKASADGSTLSIVLTAQEVKDALQSDGTLKLEYELDESDDAESIAEQLNGCEE
jgi:hypothetical protein